MDRLAPTISPNPSNGNFVVDIPELQQDGSDVSVRVLDAQGKEVYRRFAILPAGPQQTRHRLPTVPAGVYQVVVAYEGQRHVSRLVIRR